MSKLRCAVLDDYQNIALTMADWSSLEDSVEVVPFHRHIERSEHLVEAVRDYDILVAMRERATIDGAVLASLPRLKLLVTTGMRNAAIDIAFARSRGVVVCGTGSASEPPVELTWALILALARNIVQENYSLRTGGAWQSSVGADLHGKTLGILGLGKIGARVARVGSAFGMNVLAWSQHLTRNAAEAAGVELAASKEVLVASSDFVTIHLVLSDRTRGLIGARDWQLFRRTAYLVNTSRAAIVDQASLLKALQNGWIAGAAIDVFDQEPLPADHPFRSLPNLLATPHLGYVTKGNYVRYYREVVEDIHAFLTGTPIRTL